MKIQITRKFADEPDKPVCIATLAQNSLDGYDHDLGQLEAIEKTNFKTREAFGRLLNLMAENNMITAQEILQVLNEEYNVTSSALVQ